MKAIALVAALAAASISISLLVTGSSLKDELISLAQERPLLKGAGEDIRTGTSAGIESRRVSRACQTRGRMAARYDYPDMHARDEKAQQNVFLAEWLGHCLAQGQSSEWLLLPSDAL